MSGGNSRFQWPCILDCMRPAIPGVWGLSLRRELKTSRVGQVWASPFRILKVAGWRGRVDFLLSQGFSASEWNYSMRGTWRPHTAATTCRLPRQSESTQPVWTPININYHWRQLPPPRPSSLLLNRDWDIGKDPGCNSAVVGFTHVP